MLIDASKGNGNASVASNAGLAAFEAAIVQQQAFEETLTKLAERQAQAKAEAERQKAEVEKSAAAPATQAVEVVLGGKAVETDQPVSVGAPAETAPVDQTTRGNAVNISV